MPTENRTSNTEMVSVPRELTREMLNGVCMHPDLARSLWSALLKNAPQPADQHQGEPIAWMVGSAIWWSKPEAEVDADLVGEPVIPIGPLADAGEVQRLRAELASTNPSLKHWMKRAAELSAQLTERDALLDRLRNHLIAKDVLDNFGPELFQILNIEAPERASRMKS